MFTINESAAKQITAILTENNMPHLRIGIVGGGCSGLNYTFDFEMNKNEDDFEVGHGVIIDSLSMQYVDGATLEFVEDIMGSSFNIVNPNATTTCGCGSSFAV